MTTTTFTTVEEARAAGKKLHAYCTKLPLLKDFVQLRASHPPGVPFYCDKPWYARGEQLMLAVIFADATNAAIGPAEGQPTVRFGDGFNNPTLPFEQQIIHVAIQMAEATPFLWTHDVLRTILASPPLPPHTISPSVLPHDCMFWTFESSYELSLESPDGKVHTTGTINWLLLFRTVEGLGVIWDESQDGTGTMQLYGGLLHFGQTYPDSLPTTKRSSAYISDLALKGLAFLGSPYIQAEEKRIDRAAFRRCVAVNPVEAEKRVHVVTLRHPERPEGPPADRPGGAVDWKGHWWNGGHWRAQWYPSEQAHKVIWINPYLKGPLDKPLLEKVYAVKR